MADALILEGGAATEVFVIVRPGMVPQSNLDAAKSDLRGGAIEQTPPVNTSHSSIVQSSAEENSYTGSQHLRDTSPGTQETIQTLRPFRFQRADGLVSIRAWPIAGLQSLDTKHSPAGSACVWPAGDISPDTFCNSSASLQPQPQTLELPVLLRYCQPQLALNIRQPFELSGPESDSARSITTNRQGLVVVDFGDVVLGRCVSTELNLMNQSDIDCFWQARQDGSLRSEGRRTISLSNFVTGEPRATVNTHEGGSQYQPQILAPDQHEQMKLLLDSIQFGAAGDIEEMLTITNLHNTSNAIRLLVRANIVPDKPSPLGVFSGDRLDFGDCCGGQWTRQLLVLRNTGDHALDVNLFAQRGFEVLFQYARLADESEEIEEISVGATAASSDKAVTFVNGEVISHSSRSGSGAASDRESVILSSHDPAFESHATTAMELIRTPKHHASSVGHDHFEPPAFDLTSSNLPPPDAPNLKKKPIVLQPFVHPPALLEAVDSDDNENSSVASQAGSRPASPIQASDISELESMPQKISDDRNSMATNNVGDCTTRTSGSKTNSVLAWREASQHSDAQNDTSSHAGNPVEFARSFEGYSPFDSRQDAAYTDKLPNESITTSSVRDENRSSARSRSTSFSFESPSQAPNAIRTSSTGSASNAIKIGSIDSNTSGSALFSSSRKHKRNRELENLLLRTGEESRIVVSFKPVRGEIDNSFSAGHLVENIFRITLDYVKARGNVHSASSRSRGSRDRKTVLCRTRTCTSFITVAPSKLDFGETNVGTRKSSQIVVANQSDLTARVDLRFVSKVLSMYRDEMTIPARQSVHLTVDYSPRRVNVSYSKQITVANLLNRRNDQVIDVRGKNIDEQRISFHSLFYRILTPHGSNFLEFGDVNINSSRLRTFAIENTSRSPLALDITAAHTEDLALYVKADPSDSERDSGTHMTSSWRLNAPSKGPAPDPSNSSTAVGPKLMAMAIDAGGADKSKGAQLKERFLDSITSDTPASVRQENALWRTAQKLSHFRQGIAPTSTVVSAKEGQAGGAKVKSIINVAAALKRGGKGRATQRYGRSLTYKDRTVLQKVEWLDLASGPPLVAKRISVKSKCFQMLEQLEAGERRVGKSFKEPGAAGDEFIFNSPAPIQKKFNYNRLNGTAPGLGASSKSQGALTELQTPLSPVPRLPSPLAKEIASQAETPSKALARARNQDLYEKSKRLPALTGKRKVGQSVFEPADLSTLTVDELVAAVEAQPNALSTLFFNSPQAEEKHVRTEVNLSRELKNAIHTGKLAPLGVLRIPSGQERQVVAVWCPNGSTRPHIQGTARKQDSRIFLKLVDYDADAVRRSSEFHKMATLDREELPIRDLMVRTIACRALLELGQPHINFGQMQKGDSKARKILIHNRSEWAESYCIRKSGSIASGDIKLSSGRFGVVPAHGKREIEFVFCPSLTGPFNEKLVIENVADRDRDLPIYLKATVHKKPNFSVEPAVIDFGECKPGKLTETEFITVSNITGKARTFVVAVDAHDLRHQRTIMDLVFSTIAEGEGRTALSLAEETSIAEEIEHISQKLKVALRKGQGDRVKKCEERLSELARKKGEGSNGDGKPNSGANTEPSGSGSGEAAMENDSVAFPPVTEGPLHSPISTNGERNLDPARLKRVSSTVTVGVGANQSKRIALRLRTSAVHTAMVAPANADPAQQVASTDSRGVTRARPEGEDVSVNVRIHELKNQDETRIVSVKVRALWAARSSSMDTPDRPENVAIEADHTPPLGQVMPDGMSSQVAQSGMAHSAALTAIEAPELCAAAHPDSTSKVRGAEIAITDAESELETSADPLPLNDGASIVFSADSSWA